MIYDYHSNNLPFVLPYRQPSTLPIIAALVFSATVGCSHKMLKMPVAATNTPSDNSYMDLRPGERLRVLVPVFKSGTDHLTTASEHTEGNTIVLSATNLVGYEVSYYSIEDKGKGKVRLRFTSAEMTKDGKTVPEPSAPVLPFPLPTQTRHIRLIYLVRRSQSDHNMAVAAAKNLPVLNSLTERLKGDPSICQQEGETFCAWVPTGMAVRPEPLASSKQKEPSSR